MISLDLFLKPFREGTMVDLSELRDIHLPAPIHPWWPLAPGYLILLFVTLSLGIVLIFFYRKKRLVRQIKKAALKTLETLVTQYQSGQQSAHESAAQVNVLLKQIALLYYPRSTVAALEGDAWILFLSKTSKKLDFHTAQEAILIMPYSQHPPTSDAHLTTLFVLTKKWIKQRRRPCLS